VIERVRLQQIRSWTAGEIRFSAGPQILWGANGAGKTTTIEALLVAATGRSHRASALRELVQEGASSGAFTVTLRVRVRRRTIRLRQPHSPQRSAARSAPGIS
jgi:DNA replication and repair protein RecF